MQHMLVTQSAIINAPRETVYAVIADYEVGHQAILPKPYFKRMTVLEGGQGAGTEIEVDMEVFGVEASYHQRVSEPELGHVIVERDINTGLASTFYLKSMNADTQTEVKIVAEIALSGGIRSLMERLFNPLIIGHILKKELQNLQAYVRRNTIATAP